LDRTTAAEYASWFRALADPTRVQIGRPFPAAPSCTGQASFETTAPAWEAFDAGKLPLHRHVAADAATGQLLGWTAASPVSSRCVCAGVIEHSVYVDPGHRGRGQRAPARLGEREDHQHQARRRDHLA